MVKESAGVVGLVLSWDFPLLMAAWQLAPALAAGCSCLVKPVEQTPLTAMRLAQLAQLAGIPDGVPNVLPGLGETKDQAIGHHPNIDVVFFTGSTEVGGYFLRYSGESSLKVIGLEMGGKIPFIVLDDADLNDDRAELFGQYAPSVDAKLATEFAARVVARAQRFVVGDPLDPDTNIGAMVTAEHQDRVMSYIKKGSTEGAKVISGGYSMGPFYFIQPTVFAGLDAKMTIAREEIFGPVLGILPVEGMK